jgi:hypothetical protein
MLHMAFKLLGGPVVGKVVEAGTRWFEKRAEIAEAKHTARLEIEAKKATADIDWDQIMARASASSWKDELLTIWAVVVLTLVFLPWTQEWALAGLRGLEAAPEWFQILIITVFAASFGVRDLIRNRLGRK